MKPAALWDRLLELTSGPFDRRQTFAVGASYGLTQCARIVATLAPAEAVENYVHTVMQRERALTRWRLGFTTVGGLMPTLFMSAGWFLFSNGWLVLCAQLAWITLWVFVGLPWLFCTMDEHQLEIRAEALTAMCQTTSPTKEQLNEASARLGLGIWTDHDPREKDDETR